MSTLKIKRENGKIFCPLADSWHIETPEEKVRQEYIKILVENYGYSLDQMAQEIKVNNSQRGQGKARADIVIWKSKQDKIESKAAFIVVECKAENVRIREEDYYQGYNYASWAGASFFVTTNEKETKYFNVDKDSFSDWNIQGGGKDFEKEGHGAFQIFTTSQIVRFDCYGMQEADMNALTDILLDFGCPLYDPQISTRFDSWTDR